VAIENCYKSQEQKNPILQKESYAHIQSNGSQTMIQNKNPNNVTTEHEDDFGQLAEPRKLDNIFVYELDPQNSNLVHRPTQGNMYVV
jgi:hypothetical protein